MFVTQSSLNGSTDLDENLHEDSLYTGFKYSIDVSRVHADEVAGRS
jgi:hypothetical protein